LVEKNIRNFEIAYLLRAPLIVVFLEGYDVSIYLNIKKESEKAKCAGICVYLTLFLCKSACFLLEKTLK